MSSAKSLVGGVKDYPNNHVLKAVLPIVEEKSEAIDKGKKIQRESALAHERTRN
jgi:hypothetical protein